MLKIILALLLFASPALGQSPVLQSGTVTPGHAVQWTTDGVIQDAGTAAQGTLTSLGITAQGPSFCQNSDLVTNPFVQMCLGVNTSSAAVISLASLGGAADQTLCFDINGSQTCLPLGFPGTFAISGTPPIVVDPTTGNITCSLFTGSVKGCVPGSGGGTANFMRADGTWAVPSGSGIGTVMSATIAAGTGISVSGTCTITTTGTCTVANTGVTLVASGTGLTGGTITTTGTLSLATISADNLLLNATGGSAAPTGQAVGSCSATSDALTYSTSGHAFGCKTDVASLTVADQTLSGGANVTSGNLGTVTSGTTTIDCGTVPLQFFTNGGASTLAAPANDGSCMVLMTNNGSAGTITPSGFTVGSNVGATLDTTNAHKFTFSIWRINGTSGYTVFAHQ